MTDWILFSRSELWHVVTHRAKHKNQPNQTYCGHHGYAGDLIDAKSSRVREDVKCKTCAKEFVKYQRKEHVITTRTIDAKGLKVGDVFRVRGWEKGRWCVCTVEPIDARGSTISADTPTKDSFLEVGVCSWNPKKRALAHGDGPYIGLGLKQRIMLNDEAKGTAFNQLNYLDRILATGVQK